ncbi:MAG: hypothetical protein VW498_03125 [Candidatus Thalassarchaeaceae archaeon]
MNLNSGRTTLIEAVADAQRRRAESAIRPPKDFEIFVEGHTDRKYLQKHNHDSKYTIKVFEKNRRGGKDLIIEHINNTPNTYAIVDMDHHFDEDKLKNWDNKVGGFVRLPIVDTRSQCCLFAFGLEHSNGIEISTFCSDIIKRVCQRLQKEKIDLMPRQVIMLDALKKNELNLHQYLRARTIARLYRGDSRQRIDKNITRKHGLQKWDNVGLKEEHQVSDLVNQNFTDYKKFAQDYSDELEQIGYNDHEVEAAIVLLFEKFYPYFSQHREIIYNIVRREFSKKFVSLSKKEHWMYFLQELKKVSDLE